MEGMYREEAIDFLQMGVTLMQRQRYEEAIEILHKALEIEPSYEDVYRTLSDAYASLERYADAMEAIKKAILINPDRGESYFDMGNIYILQDDLQKGVENYNKADQIGFHSFPLYKNLAEIYRDLNEEELALRNYNKAIDSEPLRADIRLEKAGYYILLGKFYEALETLENLQKIEPDLYDVYAMRAEIFCGLREYDKAKQLLDSAIAEYPDDPALLAERIKVLIRTNELEEAKKEIAYAKEMEGYEFVSRNILLQEAQIASMENNLEKAAEVLGKIVADSEELDEEAVFLLMNAYYGMGNEDKVLEEASLLAGSDSENLFTVSGKYFLPFIMKKQGKTEEANAQFRRLTSYLRRLTVRDPHFYEAYIYRLLAHKELGEYDKALELADYIEALDINSSDAHALRYAIYRDMGEFDKARESKAKAGMLNSDLQL